MSGPEPTSPEGADERWRRLQDVPAMRDEPIAWDHRAGSFVPSAGVWPSEARPEGAAAPAPSDGPPAGDDRPTASPPAAAAPPQPGPRPAPSPAPPARRHVVINAGEQAVRPGAEAGHPSAAGGAAAIGTAAPPVAPPPPGPHPAVPPPPLPPAPARRSGPPLRLPRLRPRRVLRMIVVIPLVLALLFGAFVAYEFSKIPRVPVASVLSSGGALATNWLIVGTDSREGISADEPDAGAFLGPGEPSGSRTDSIMVLRTGVGGDALLSVPRDLWVKDPKTGQFGRINGTYGAGAANLITAVQGVGIPVHHYAEINFVAFGRLVDAVGGITVTFESPARDTHSGLDIPEAGPRRLDGSQALAYVRSRYYEELKGGRWQQEALSDLARVQRQRTFLTTLMHEVAATRNPIKLARITDALTVGLKIDDAVGLLDALRLGWSLKGFDPESVTLPTVNANRGGAAVLDLDKTKAPAVIQRFG